MHMERIIIWSLEKNFNYFCNPLERKWDMLKEEDLLIPHLSCKDSRRPADDERHFFSAIKLLAFVAA